MSSNGSLRTALLEFKRKPQGRQAVHLSCFLAEGNGGEGKINLCHLNWHTWQTRQGEALGDGEQWWRERGRKPTG